VTKSFLGRTHKEAERVAGSEESNDPIFFTQSGPASSSGGVSSGDLELLRQGVCSRCASAWFVWDSALSRSLLQSSIISPRDEDLGI
jgi:hypothetical protein